MRTVALLAAIAACGHVGFDGGTPTQSTLSLDRMIPGEPLTDFPLLVVLDDTRADRATMQPDASDLRFYAADGSPLAFEIEQVGAPGRAPLVAWVRIPSIPDATMTITASYGVSGWPRATSSAWSDAYEAVWHMTGSGALLDSTAHHRDGVASGTTSVAGQIGAARSFDSSQQDWIGVADGGTIHPQALTLSGWIYMPTPEGPSGYDGIVTREDEDSSGGDDFYLATTEQAAYGAVTVDDVEVQQEGAAIQLGQWTHLVATWDGQQLATYVGATGFAPVPAQGTLAADTTPVYIGADRNDESGTTPDGVADDDFTDGSLDEIRVENVARDAAWIAYDLASQQDQIITYGPVRAP